MPCRCQQTEEVVPSSWDPRCERSRKPCEEGVVSEDLKEDLKQAVARGLRGGRAHR